MKKGRVQKASGVPRVPVVLRTGTERAWPPRARLPDRCDELFEWMTDDGLREEVKSSNRSVAPRREGERDGRGGDEARGPDGRNGGGNRGGVWNGRSSDAENPSTVPLGSHVPEREAPRGLPEDGWAVRGEVLDETGRSVCGRRGACSLYRRKPGWPLRYRATWASSRGETVFVSRDEGVGPFGECRSEELGGVEASSVDSSIAVRTRVGSSPS